MKTKPNIAVFVDRRNKKFFRSGDESPLLGFTRFRTYGLPCGDIDYQALDNDRSDLIDAGYSEMQDPRFLVVKLFYMKESGKYYSEGELKVSRAEAEAEPAKNWLKVCDQVRKMLEDGELPGLVRGSRFDIFVSCEEHPNYVPVLIKTSSLR